MANGVCARIYVSDCSIFYHLEIGKHTRNTFKFIKEILQLNTSFGVIEVIRYS